MSNRVTVCVLLALASVGCVMPDQVSRMEKELADVRHELAAARQEQARTQEELDAMRTRASSEDETVSRSDLAEMTVRVDRVERDAAIGAEQTRDLDQRIDRLSQQVEQSLELARRASTSSPYDPQWVAAPPTPGGSMTPVTNSPTGTRPPINQPSDVLPDAEALYNTAYADFSKGNYALAVSGFQEYQQKFSDSALADNALYWVGECYFSQGDFVESVRAMDELLEQYPESDKAAAANLKKSLAYLEQNQIGLAIVQFRYVIAHYPSSDEAKIARDKLTSLGAPV